jgi:hypothetical protein
LSSAVFSVHHNTIRDGTSRVEGAEHEPFHNIKEVIVKNSWSLWLPMLALGVAGCEFPTGFYLRLPNPTETLARGNRLKVIVGVGVMNYNPSPATLTVSGLPSGVSAQFDPAQLSQGESTLTLTASTSATLGSAELTITGQSQTKTNAVKMQLNVTDSAAPTSGLEGVP